MTLVSIEDISRAASALVDVAVRTPLLAFPSLEEPGALWLKLESLQATGSFKLRGAYNAISSLPVERRDRGVITYSSGNHAQAVAYAARAFRAPCIVVMPDDAPWVKVQATRALGAEIVLVPPAERKRHAEELSAEDGLALIPPYDHPDVIAGQGTVGLEIVQDLPTVEVVLVPVGGGALASGVASAVKALQPSVSVVGVEPELASDAAASLRSGRLEAWPMTLTGRTVADGLRTNLSELTLAHLAQRLVSELTLAHLAQRLDAIVTVSDEEILAGVGELARSAHLVVEPSGAVSVAGYLCKREELPSGRTVAVVSGGNIDPGLFADVISRWLVSSSGATPAR